MQSWSARCLAVRKVTQDNRGKKTAGVDGVKSLKPPDRRRLARQVRLPQKARPTRRGWIPQPGTQDQRGWGIPTLQERAAQALAKLALEPEWEARFEPNSYGFRPGRSCHDAISAMFDAIKSKPKYVLDADSAKCFDRINHDELRKSLQTFPTLRRAIRAWLRAGVMDGGTLFPTREGTPQGGVLSPLLANIALHGFETVIREAFPERKPGTNIHWKPIVVRYADDFVVMHEDETVIPQVQQRAMEWQAGQGAGSEAKQNEDYASPLHLPRDRRIRFPRVHGAPIPRREDTHRKGGGKGKSIDAAGLQNHQQTQPRSDTEAFDGTGRNRRTAQTGPSSRPDCPAQPGNQGLDYLLRTSPVQGYLLQDGSPNLPQAPTLG